MFYFPQKVLKCNNFKLKESIPVGCIPPAFVVRREGGWGSLPPIPYPPGVPYAPGYNTPPIYPTPPYPTPPRPRYPTPFPRKGMGPELSYPSFGQNDTCL